MYMFLWFIGGIATIMLSICVIVVLPDLLENINNLKWGHKELDREPTFDWLKDHTDVSLIFDKSPFPADKDRPIYVVTITRAGVHHEDPLSLPVDFSLFTDKNEYYIFLDALYSDWKAKQTTK